MINGSGVVAFHGHLDIGAQGIYLWPNPLADKIIATGDPLFGSVVTGISMGCFGLYDSGSLAFSASLADGRTVIARADPRSADVIPEPASLVLLAVGPLVPAFLARGPLRTRNTY